MTRKEDIQHEVAEILEKLTRLSDKYAREPNEMLALIEAEKAMHEVLKTFEQELDIYP